MPPSSPERIKRIYGLWYEYLCRSDLYRRFCEYIRKAEGDYTKNTPDEFLIKPLVDVTFSKKVWAVYFDQWGDVFEISFDDFWVDHGRGLIARWQGKRSLTEDVAMVELLIWQHLTDKKLDVLRKQTSYFRLRSLELRDLSSQIVLHLNTIDSKLSGLDISLEVRKSIKVDVLESDLKIYDRYKTAKKSGQQIKKLIEQLNIPKRSYYDSISRAKKSIEAAELGFFPT